MKRFLTAIVVVGVALNSGLTFAQDEDAPQIPEKVRKFLDNLAGTWNMVSPSKGRTEIKWDAGMNALSDQFQVNEASDSWSAIWHWDGKSDDGIIVSWIRTLGKGIMVGNLHGRVLSETTMKGQVTFILDGKKGSSNAFVEVKDSNQYTWKATNIIVDGEQQPDDTAIYTRVKPTTREDFEDFCQLFKGRWVSKMTLFDDRPGFGVKGDTFTAYFHSTLSENGNYIVSRVNMGKAWQTQLKYYDPIAKVIKTTCALSSGATSYATDRKVPGGWRTNIVQIGADGTNEGELILDHTFSEDGKTWTVKVSSPGDESNILATYVWRRMNK